MQPAVETDTATGSEPGSLAPLLHALAARGHHVRSAAPMAGDVSRRCYHRLTRTVGRTLVLAVYPDDLRDVCRRSLETGRLLAAQGVRVARVLDQDCAAGWALLEDLGERTLYEEGDRPWSELAPFFEDTVSCIGRIARIPREAVVDLNPPLDRDLLRRELGQTREVFFEPLGLTAGDAGQVVEEALDRLCECLGADAQASLVPCHRDLGARNLMPLAEEDHRSVGVLDHQDLRLGPPAYDLASLLNDSLFPPPEVEEHLLRLAGFADASGRTLYHRAAAQRTLKAVGSYAAFARRGSDRHLPLVPPTLRRALRHLRATPETADVAPRFAELWTPVLAGEGLDRLRG